MNVATNMDRYLVERISPGESLKNLLAFPRYFEIETVNVCNARCPMCTIAEWQRSSPTMKDDLFAKIRDEICAHAPVVKRVALYRDGEPLLDKKIAERVHAMKTGGIELTNLSTNVSLLNESRATALLEAGLDELVLSIDSLKKDVFERIRVRLDFDEVLENALRYIRLRDRIRPKSRIRIRMIRQRDNHDEWADYVAFWRPKLADHDSVSYLNIHNWGGQLQSFDPVSVTGNDTRPCVALWSLMTIFANGDVPMCNVDFNNDHPTGNVIDRTIADVWRSSAANLHRELHFSGRRAEIPPCRDCTVWTENQTGEARAGAGDFALT